MFKKVIMISLVIVLCLSFGATAMAKEKTSVVGNEVELRFTHINSATASLEILSSGQANCAATIFASDVDSVKIKGYLQYYNNGWTTVKSWTVSSSGALGQLVKSWNVSKGYKYRFLAYHYAYSGLSTESTSRSAYWDYY